MTRHQQPLDICPRHLVDCLGQTTPPHLWGCLSNVLSVSAEGQKPALTHWPSFALVLYVSSVVLVVASVLLWP